MIYCFDIDGTICSSVENSQYEKAIVFDNMLNKINDLYEKGNTIIFMTARGCVSGKDWSEFTKSQLKDWGFKYHKLIMNQKPHAHYFIDDKGYNAANWSKKNAPSTRGVIAGAFDVIHPGYIDMFKKAKQYCDNLTICLHVDPKINGKMKPILNVEERKFILSSICYVDEIITYYTEKDLLNILKNNNYDIRILGNDYIDKEITGNNLTKKTIFVDRSHGWSTTKFKKMIYDSFKEIK